MKKIKVGRSDSIRIATEKMKFLGPPPKEKIDYDKWVEFIENHQDYFIWFENTEQGKGLANENIESYKENYQIAIRYMLNKKEACSTNKIVKDPLDFTSKYIENKGYVKISIERKMSKEVAEILLKMAKYVGGKLFINGTKELESIEQLG